MQVNRYLKDKPMDQIDHALGRPVDPIAENSRNFYAASGPQADEMAASPHWQEGRPGRDLRYFTVTDEGRKALASHLRELGDPHRAYTVTFAGYPRSVVSASASKARYDHFLHLRDVMPDLDFKDFCRRSSVRLAR